MVGFISMGLELEISEEKLGERGFIRVIVWVKSYNALKY